jgi:flagellar FliL protein
MAETKDDIDIKENEGGKSKKKLIIIAAAVLLLGGGAAAFFFMAGDETLSEDAAEAKPIKQAAIYHTVEKPFVINFDKQSGNRVKYMQIKLKVMARDQEAVDAIKLHMPAIQHALLMLFFSQNYDAMNTKEGTKALRKETLTTINDLLTAEKQPSLLEAVYFTSLIMQ